MISKCFSGSEAHISRTVECGGSWLIKAEGDPYLISLIGEIARGALPERGRLVRRTKKRRVWHIPSQQTGEEGVFVKEYRYFGLMWAARMLLGMETARKEWKVAKRLQSQGVHACEMVALGRQGSVWEEARSFLVSREIHDAYPLVEWLRDLGRDHVSERIELVERLALFMAGLHNIGVEHLDMHAGNLLVQPKAEGLTIHLVDFQHVRLRRSLNTLRRTRNFAHLFHSLQGLLSLQHQRDVLDIYSERTGVSLSPQRLEMEKRAVLRHWRRRRTRKCLKDGSSFGRIKDRRRRVHFHRGFPVERLDQILIEARALKGVGGPEVLKDGRETTITRHRFAVDGETWRLCVKRYHPRGWTDHLRALFQWSRARRAWVAGWGLQIRDILSPIPRVMLIEKSFGLPREGFVAMDEVPDAMPLSRYVGEKLLPPSEANTTNRRRFVKTAAGYIARLHAREIYHRDLKATNLLVRETGDGWAISLVDHDHIRFDRTLAYRERVTNLAQLNASVPNEVRPMDRWRFLLIYSDGAPRGDIRRMAADIARISAMR